LANGAAGPASGAVGTAVADPPVAAAPAEAPTLPGAPAPAGPGPGPGAPAAHPNHALQHHARHRTAGDPVINAGGRPKKKRRRLLFLIPILFVVLVAAGVMGYRYWYESTYYVSTDNASITGDLIQVGSLNAGRIVATRVDVGAQIRQGQEIAVVAMPQELGGATLGSAPRMGVTGNSDTLVPVNSPLTGIVAARTGYIGGTVAAGQPIYALIDPAKVWVRANIEESSAWRVAIGQPVEVHVDALNRDLMGRVESITPASAATFSLLPSGNVSGNFTKVTQYVPIKVVVDAPGIVLPLGTSAEVRIQVRQPTEEYPLPWQQ
jgi:multidrug resistance efflux pump